MSKMTKTRKTEILNKLQKRVGNLEYTARLFGHENSIALTSGKREIITSNVLKLVEKEVPELVLISIMKYGVELIALYDFVE